MQHSLHSVAETLVAKPNIKLQKIAAHPYRLQFQNVIEKKISASLYEAFSAFSCKNTACQIEQKLTPCVADNFLAHLAENGGTGCKVVVLNIQKMAVTLTWFSLTRK